MAAVTVAPASLDRRLGLGDAVFIGLGSMIGAGVFAAYGPAARAAGTGLLVGLAVAAVVAYCNATASAQLAAAYPRAGGTYLYGREVLGDWWGYLAGWGFMVGKTASCAAMALTFAAYVAPDGWLRPVAAAVVVVLTLVNCAGDHPHRAAHPRPRLPGARGPRGGGRRLLPRRFVVRAGRLGLADARAVRRPAVGRPAVLRLRRLRPDRHAGRGGARAGAGDPAGDRARPGRRGRGVRRRRRRRALGARAAPGPLRRPLPSPTPSRATSADWVVGCRPGRSRPRLGRCAARAGRRARAGPGWPWPASATCRAGWTPYTRATGCRTGPSSPSPRSSWSSCSRPTCAARSGSRRSGCCSTTSSPTPSAYRQPTTARRFPRWLQLLGGTGCLVLVATLPWQSVVAGVLVFAVGIVIRLIRLRAVSSEPFRAVPAVLRSPPDGPRAAQ